MVEEVTKSQTPSEVLGSQWQCRRYGSQRRMGGRLLGRWWPRVRRRAGWFQGTPGLPALMPP
eukprot:6063921-Prymnesium_polylepis.1